MQIRRPCAVAVLDSNYQMVDAAWLAGNASQVCRQLTDQYFSRRQGIEIGIDAPRTGLQQKREFYWGRREGWRRRRATDRGWGRHCEVVVSAAGLANPQWTPPVEESPPWMQLGFELHRILNELGFVTHEVFPSAAYRLLESEQVPLVGVDLSQFSPGPKDMLDACCAAFSVHEFRKGAGAEVGSDGLGTIVLPRPIPKSCPAELLNWPTAEDAVG